MHESGGKANRVTCILAHDLVNKIAAIVGHCDILAMKSAGLADVECREHLDKVRNLATSMALMVQQSECAVHAVNEILALQDAFAADHRKKLPRTEHFEVEDPAPSPR